MTLKDQVAVALKSVNEPASSRTLEDLGLVAGLSETEGVIGVQLVPPSADYDSKSALEELVHAAAESVPGVVGVDVHWKSRSGGREIPSDDPIPGVQDVILVMSGKGGVGKSTVASNLALALSRQGYRVGLLDADIYGPSIPTMFGITGRPESNGDKIVPLQRFGVKLMSIGFLLEDPKAAVVWRGPMLHGALMQFIGDVDWGDLDYLLLDLPPGTGDIALTLSQKIRSTGAVIVTTPQEVALMDVYKSVSMALKVGIEVLGVVENASFFVCDDCGKQHDLYGKGGGQKVADQAKAPLLGQVPIVPEVRQWGDAGTPIVQASPGSDVAKVFMSIATRLGEEVELATQGRAGAGLSIDRSGGVNRHLPITR